MRFLLHFFFPKLSSHFKQLYFLHFLNDGSKGSFLLLLPFLTTDLHLSLTQAGFLATIVNLLSVVLALPTSYIAMKVGGLKTMIIALFLYGIGFLGTSFSPNYFWIFPMAVLAGIGFGLFHPIGFALIAKWSNKEERGRQMGDFTAVGDLGRIGIAAVITFIVAFLGWRFTSFAYALILIVIAVIFYFFYVHKREQLVIKEQPKTRVRLRDLIRHKQFFYATVIYFLDSLASGSLFVFLPFLLLARDINPALLGSFVALFFLGNFAGKTLLGRFVDQIGSVKVFVASQLLMTLFIIFLAGARSLPLIIFCSLVLGVFTKGTSPVINTMISESVEHHGDFEKSFGVSQLAGTVGTTLAPLLLGIVSDKFGIISAFYLMAGFALVAIIPAFGFHRAKKVMSQ